MNKHFINTWKLPFQLFKRIYHTLAKALRLHSALNRKFKTFTMMNKTQRVLGAAIELMTSDWPLHVTFKPIDKTALWSSILLTKFSSHNGCSLPNLHLVDLCVTFDLTNVLHTGQGLFWPNLVIIIINIIRQIDLWLTHAWSLTPQMKYTLVDDSFDQIWLLWLLN